MVRRKTSKRSRRKTSKRIRGGGGGVVSKIRAALAARRTRKSAERNQKAAEKAAEKYNKVYAANARRAARRAALVEGWKDNDTVRQERLTARQTATEGKYRAAMVEEDEQELPYRRSSTSART